MINAIWESTLHGLSEWDEAVNKGKVLMENNQKTVEDCLVDMSNVIVKLKWHEKTLLDEHIKDNKKLVVLHYLEQILLMLIQEFDLKACLASQYSGPLPRRKLIIYMWITQPHIDEAFLQTLPKSIS